MYTIIYSTQAQRDAKKINQAGYKDKVEYLVETIRNNPFQNPPRYKKLQGVDNTYSRRINKQHRLVYEVIGNIIHIDSMWSHYENIN